MGSRKSTRIRQIGEHIQALIKKKDPDGSLRQIARVYSSWPEIVGEHIAELAHPLRHRQTILVLGVEDSVLMQELGYYSPAIIEQVNTFLGMHCFDKVQLELLCTPVSQKKPVAVRSRRQQKTLDRPKNLGMLQEKFAVDSPVGQAYAAYVRLFEKSETKEQNQDTVS